ncbi:MAG: hypothetical protein AMJ69_09515 [Gammaproteobacteria bacterium SG8_47]|nr:MAG: hypothetical protein AMJ69_09515 [Gammaproteobacteria bacterium SG8_47]
MAHVERWRHLQPATPSAQAMAELNVFQDRQEVVAETTVASKGRAGQRHGVSRDVVGLAHRFGLRIVDEDGLKPTEEAAIRRCLGVSAADEDILAGGEHGRARPLQGIGQYLAIGIGKEQHRA